jgi:hypothetical protein
MDSFEMIGRWLVIFGVVIAILGGMVWLAGRFFGVGQIPGTLRFDFPGGTCVIPILASIVLSLVLTLLLNIVVRFLNR